MPSTLALIHTSTTMVPVFKDLCAQYFAQLDVECFHIADDSLIGDTIRKGRLTATTAGRLVGYLQSAEAAGADHILVTCSSVGHIVEMGASLVEVPVTRVDFPMAEHAVSVGTRIGVAATLPTTLEPTSDLIRRQADRIGKEVTLSTRCCGDAFEALMAGYPDDHDARVRKALKELAGSTDVVVLAQASMARVVETLKPEDQKVPILASPPLAMEFLREHFENGKGRYGTCDPAKTTDPQ
jgi:Asp/Glu/hydantoin racemase